jgi:hypothetical protein
LFEERLSLFAFYPHFEVKYIDILRAALIDLVLRKTTDDSCVTDLRSISSALKQHTHITHSSQFHKFTQQLKSTTASHILDRSSSLIVVVVIVDRRLYERSRFSFVFDSLEFLRENISTI